MLANQSSPQLIILNKIVGELERTEQQKQQKPNACSIVGIPFEKMSPLIAKTIEQKLQNVKWLTITKCGLRTMQGFPRLNNLENIDVSQNQLLGSFQFLVRYQRTLKYVNVSSNQIMDIMRFQAFRNFSYVYIYAKNNPFCAEKSREQFKKIVLKLKSFRVVLLEKPKLMRKQKLPDVCTKTISKSSETSSQSEQQNKDNKKKQENNDRYFGDSASDQHSKQQRKQVNQQENVFTSSRNMVAPPDLSYDSYENQERRMIIRLRGMRQRYLYRSSRRQLSEGYQIRNTENFGNEYESQSEYESIRHLFNTDSPDRNQQNYEIVQLRERLGRNSRIYEAISQYYNGQQNRLLNQGEQPDRQERNEQDLTRIFNLRWSNLPTFRVPYEYQEQAKQQDNDDDESFTISSGQTQRSNESNQEQVAEYEE